MKLIYRQSWEGERLDQCDARVPFRGYLSNLGPLVHPFSTLAPEVDFATRDTSSGSTSTESASTGGVSGVQFASHFTTILAATAALIPTSLGPRLRLSQASSCPIGGRDVHPSKRQRSNNLHQLLHQQPESWPTHPSKGSTDTPRHVPEDCHWPCYRLLFSCMVHEMVE